MALWSYNTNEIKEVSEIKVKTSRTGYDKHN